jgi:hypothetical protein
MGTVQGVHHTQVQGRWVQVGHQRIDHRVPLSALSALSYNYEFLFKHMPMAVRTRLPGGIKACKVQDQHISFFTQAMISSPNHQPLHASTFCLIDAMDEATSISPLHLRARLLTSQVGCTFFHDSILGMGGIALSQPCTAETSTWFISHQVPRHARYAPYAHCAGTEWSIFASHSRGHRSFAHPRTLLYCALHPTHDGREVDGGR